LPMLPRLAFTLMLVLAGAVPALGQGNIDIAPGNSGNAPGNTGNVPAIPAAGPGGNAPNQGTVPGAGFVDQPSPSGGTPGNITAPRPSTSVSSPAAPDAAITLSPEQVRDAVDARQAMPLAALGDVIQARGGGEIVDASLLRVDQMLVYALKVLDPLGRLSVQYFHARSGVYIGSE
jgi:hypothetical protein